MFLPNTATSIENRIWLQVPIFNLFLALLITQALTDRVYGEEDTATPYETLYDAVMIRKSTDGVAFGKNEVGPLIYGRSDYPFDDKAFPVLEAALAQFNSLSDKKIKSYSPIHRALLQRHLWTVFDATVPRSHRRPKSFMERRQSVQRVLAALIQRLALSQKEIKTLPDTLTATLKSGKYPQKYDPKDRLKPFLPSDLYTKESSWICLGKVNDYDSDHAAMAKWRSAFFQFIRLPDGRKASEEYIKKLNKREQFPAGTQFALIGQALLIDDKGNIVPSPIINSIQLRTYLDVTKSVLEAHPKPVDCVAEFVIEPLELIKGNFVMRALGPNDLRYQTIASSSGGLVDPFVEADSKKLKRMFPNMQNCINCHTRSRKGFRSLGNWMFGDRNADKITFEAGDPKKITEGVAQIKQQKNSWKQLQKYWKKNVISGDKKSSHQ